MVWGSGEGYPKLGALSCLGPSFAVHESGIHFIWVVESLEDAEWGLAMLKTAKAPEVDAAMYVTKGSDKSLRKNGFGEIWNGLQVLSCQGNQLPYLVRGPYQNLLHPT